MKNYIIVILSCCLTFQKTYSQSTNSKIIFNNINNFQLFIGDKKTGVGLETINGIKFKNGFSTGIGFGYDTYAITSIPVFLDVRKTFGNKNFKPFVYVDAGMNFTLRTADYPKFWEWGGNYAYIFKNSFYGAAGIGIYRTISKNSNFLFSAGVNIKQFKYLYNNPWVMDVAFDPNYIYNFKFNRYNIKMGIEF